MRETIIEEETQEMPLIQVLNFDTLPGEDIGKHGDNYD